MVLAKVGGSGFSAMVLISSLWRLIPSVMAGLKCSFLMRSKGGVSKGEVQAEKSGLSAVEEDEAGFASSLDFSPDF